jgi:hypothetical protein
MKNKHKGQASALRDEFMQPNGYGTAVVDYALFWDCFF